MADYSDNFEAFWKAYPRKTAKLTAWKAWEKQGMDADAFLPQVAIQDVEKRNRFKFWPTDRSKIPHGATWINQHRWEDEGWEDEIKTRKDEPTNTGRVEYTPPEDTGPDLSKWQMMMNRLMLRYMYLYGYMDPLLLDRLVKEKNRTYKEMHEALAEEVAAAEDKKKAMGECSYTLAHTMLRRLDSLADRDFTDRIIKMGRGR